MTLKVCPQHWEWMQAVVDLLCSCSVHVAGNQLRCTFMTSKDSNYYGYILEIQVPDAMVFLHKL